MPLEKYLVVFRKYKKIALFGTVIIVALIALGVGLGIHLTREPVGGIVTNGHECAKIGGDVLKRGGSVVDAAIAALFCEGIAMPQTMGLGGGFLMTIYIKKGGIVKTLNAREMAPKNAHEDMYKNNLSLATRGGLASAIPGELKGYQEIHRKYGKLPWRVLVRPAILLCKNGHLVTPYLEKVFKDMEKDIRSSPTMREIYINKETDSTYKAGDYIKRLDLVDFLETVAVEGADALYDGTYTKSFVDDVNKLGGNMTVDDLKNYKPEWMNPIRVKMPFGQTLYTIGPPGSGVVLSLVMNILKDFIDYSAPKSIQTMHRIIESFKYGYGKRTELGDPRFVEMSGLVANLTSEDYALSLRKNIWDNRTFSDPRKYGINTSLLMEDHGTAHISILAPNGDAVSVTSTINLRFGAMVRSRSTGIILNDEMDDFSSPHMNNSYGVPPSKANYIRPGKRPVSSMVPTIIVDKNNNVRLVLGSAGGTRITTSVALVTIRHLWFNQTLKEAVRAIRFHHQLFPMIVELEHGYDEKVLGALRKIGHNYTIQKPDGFVSLTAIARIGNTVEGSHDPRRAGSVVLINIAAKMFQKRTLNATLTIFVFLNLVVCQNK